MNADHPPIAISDQLRQQLLAFQRNEITEYHIYMKLARRVKLPENRRVLEQIANEERRHYRAWQEYTGQEVEPDRRRVWIYYWISRLLGLTFGVKLMELGEEEAQANYHRLRGLIPEEDLEKIILEESRHEAAILQLLDEERLRYAGSVVLGLNDALVELTGALAGLTFALQDTALIALTGSITGIAAALSMGASEYLSTKAETTVKNPVRASLYTGTAYLVTVLLLILPYLILENYYLCLALSLAAAVAIIALFNYYISIAQDEPFRRRFAEMVGLSLGVATFSFLVGVFLRSFLGVSP